jgi:NADH-quinone oxidoreductase subunit C
MTQQEIIERLRAAFSDKLGEWVEMTNGNEYQRRTGSYLQIADPQIIRSLCLYLRDEKELGFNSLLLLSSVDNGDGTLSVVYHIESTRRHQQLALKVTVSAEHAVVPSVTDVWSHANWQEREAWDMMGIRFTGHPDHRRILLDEDWPGHPLRKDFKEPDFFHGMKVPY